MTSTSSGTTGSSAPPWENREQYDRLSPLLRAGRVQTPTLFLGGRDDWNVPILNAELFYQSLRKRGIDTQLVVYPGMHHSGWTTKSRRIFCSATSQWFDRYLGGTATQDTDDDSRRARRNERRAMKPCPDPYRQDASLAAAVEAMQANRPLRAEEICRAYLDEPRLRRAPAPARQCAEQAGAVRRAEQTVRLAIALQPDFPTCTRTSAACWRCSTGSRKRSRASSRPSGSSRACRWRTRSSARPSPPWAAARTPTPRSRSSSSWTPLAARSRWRSITCTQDARPRPSTRCAARCARTPATSTRCASWRRSTGARKAAERCRSAAAACDDAGAELHGAWLLLGADAARGGTPAESIECYLTATRIEPDNAMGWSGLGNGYAHVGDVEKAIAAPSSARWPCIRTCRTCSWVTATSSRPAATSRPPCAPTGPRSRCGRTSAKSTGAWRTSRSSASTTPRSRRWSSSSSATT